MHKTNEDKKFWNDKKRYFSKVDIMENNEKKEKVKSDLILKKNLFQKI